MTSVQYEALCCAVELVYGFNKEQDGLIDLLTYKEITFLPGSCNVSPS